MIRESLEGDFRLAVARLVEQAPQRFDAHVGDANDRQPVEAIARHAAGALDRLHQVTGLQKSPADAAGDALRAVAHLRRREQERHQPHEPSQVIAGVSRDPPSPGFGEAGTYLPGWAREATPTRFHRLIAATVQVRAL